MPTVEWMYNYRSGLGEGILNTGKTLLWMQIHWILLRIRLEKLKKKKKSSEKRVLRATPNPTD